MFISLTSLLLASYISAVVAAPLDTRNLVDNELEIRGPPAKGAAKSCPAKAAGKKRSVDLPRRSILQEIVELYRRNDEEFIGWHGTNKGTADMWVSHGSVIKPPGNGGRSGLDQELGVGLYITDTLNVATGASVINGQNNRLPPKVCAIYAKNRGAWNSISKAEIPEVLRGNAAEKETWRRTYLTDAAGFRGEGIRFGPLATGQHQMMIPESFNPTLKAVCYDVDAATGHSATAAAANLAVDYNHPSTKVAWSIMPAKNDEAQRIKDGVGCIVS